MKNSNLTNHEKYHLTVDELENKLNSILKKNISWNNLSKKNKEEASALINLLGKNVFRNER